MRGSDERRAIFIHERLDVGMTRTRIGVMRLADVVLRKALARVGSENQIILRTVLNHRPDCTHWLLRLCCGGLSWNGGWWTNHVGSNASCTADYVNQWEGDQSQRQGQDAGGGREQQAQWADDDLLARPH